MEKSKCVSLLPDKEVFKKYKEGYIFDEDKSVKWNREEVERQNNLYVEEKNRLMKEYNRLVNEAHDESIRYVLKESRSIKTEEQARKLWFFVWNEKHAYLDEDDIENYLDEMITLVDKIFAE